MKITERLKFLPDRIATFLLGDSGKTRPMSRTRCQGFIILHKSFDEVLAFNSISPLTTPTFHASAKRADLKDSRNKWHCHRYRYFRLQHDPHYRSLSSLTHLGSGIRGPTWASGAHETTHDLFSVTHVQLCCDRHSAKAGCPEKYRLAMVHYH